MKKHLIMKNIICFILIYGSLQVVGQDFYPSPSPASGSTTYEKFEIAVSSFVYNNTAADITLRWVRIVENIPAGWQTAVCDKNQCYLPNVDSMDFVLPASNNAKLYVQMYINNIIGSGTVQLLVYDVTGPRSNGITINYYGTAYNHFSVSDTATLSAAGTPNNSINTETQITNIDDNNINLIVKRITQSIQTGWTSAICTTGVCFSTAADSVQFTLSQGKNIPLNVVFSTDNIINTGFVDLLVYEAGDNNQSRWDTVTFNVETKTHFNVTQTKIYTAGSPTNTLTTELDVSNTSGKSITMKAVRTSNNVPSGWNSAMCTDTCLAATSDTLTFVMLSDSTTKIYTKFYTDTNMNTGNVTIQIYESGDGVNSKSFTLTGETADNYTMNTINNKNTGYPTKRVVDEGRINNVSSDSVHIVIKRIENNIPAGWSSALCLSSSCSDSNTDSLNFYITQSKNQSFYVHFLTTAALDSGNVKLQIYEIDSAGIADIANADTLIFYASTKYSFLFSDSILDATGVVLQQVSGKINVVNNADKDITLIIKRILNNIPSGWASALCEVNCLSTVSDSMKINFSKGAVKNISVKFYTNNDVDSGKVTLQIYELDGTAADMTNSQNLIFSAITTLSGIDDEQSLFSGLILYPNPTNTILRIKLPEKISPATIHIYNIIGKIVGTLEVSPQLKEIEFHTAALPSGIYFIRCEYKDNMAITKSFIISNN